MKFKPPPRFSKGFIVPDGVSARHTLVGRLYPQPRVRTQDGRDVRLDDVLGEGFAVLVRSPRAANVVPFLQDEPWSDLGARIVAIGEKPVENALLLIELGAPNPRLARYGDHVILLRPDRYVAACIPVDELQKGAERVHKLIASAA
jgi:3-(3-hydroxy-phenyl)propionate hydroxylase